MTSPTDTATSPSGASGAPAATDAPSSAGSPDSPETLNAPAGARGGRAHIDEIDAELIALVQRRMAVSAAIQTSRLAEGGRRLDLRRETEVIGRYTRALGRPGTAVAMALLELGRGRV